MSQLCSGFVGFWGGIPLIGFGCAFLLNGSLENDTDLPNILLACATPRCNLVFLGVNQLSCLTVL